MNNDNLRTALADIESLLTLAQKEGLHLDMDKAEILTIARRALYPDAHRIDYLAKLKQLKAAV